MSEKNIVNWGLAVSAWGKITVNEQGKDEYGPPTLFRGTRQINFTPDGQQTKVYADRTVVFVGNQNSGYTGTMEVTNLDDDFAMYALGETKTDKGIIVENQNGKGGRFYLLWEWEQDQKNTRHAMYNVTANRPDVAATTAGDGGSKTAQNRTLNLTAIPRADGIIKARSGKDTDQTVYNNWFTTFHDPAPATVPGG